MPVGGDTTTNHACGATMKSSFHDNNERSIERVVGIGRWRSAQCLCEATQQPTILRDDDVVVPRRQRWPQRGRGGGRTLPRSGGESTRVAQRDARFESHVVSDGPDGESSRRPWYSPAGGGGRGDGNAIPDVNDPRLARYDVARRREIVSRLLASTRSDPDVLVKERCAITTRASPSFVRVGHMDLFARRLDALLERASAGEYDDELDDDTEHEGAETKRRKRRVMDKISNTIEYRCGTLAIASITTRRTSRTTRMAMPSPRRWH